MSGEDFRDGLTWFSGRSCTARDEIEVEPVYEEDHNLVLHFALQQREEDDSFEHFVRIADSFPEPGGVFLLDEAFDGPRLAELGVDGVEEVDEVCVGGGGGVPGRAHIFVLMNKFKTWPGTCIRVDESSKLKTWPCTFICVHDQIKFQKCKIKKPGRAHVGCDQLAPEQIVLPAPILLVGQLPAEG